jgi:SAM-dependent methyltransferase
MTAPSWYHTIDLPSGPTDGAVDLRAVAPRVLPARLDGLRAVDIGTFDGFWAFELERRGAAEVLATDLERFDQSEWPRPHRPALEAEAGDRGPGERFGLAHQALGSNVRRVISAVHDITPDRLGGPVDVAVMGDLLLHLRDPVGALERVHDALAPGGRLISLEQVNVPLTLLRPRRAAGSFQARATTMCWWEPNLRALRDWLALAGFARSRVRHVYRLKAHGPQARWHVALESVRARGSG